MDIIFIKGIVCETTIGVFEWEQHVHQKLLVDIELGTQFSKAAESDDLTDALDYQKVTERVVSICEKSKCRLVEKLITTIADTLWADFDLKWLRVSLDKGSILKHAKSVGLTTERGTKG